LCFLFIYEDNIIINELCCFVSFCFSLVCFVFMVKLF